MQTDIDEWRDVAVGSQPLWEGRAQIIAKLIRSTDTVLDIGAGDQKLKRFIPPSCTYIPVDCVDSLPGTFLVDFNKEFRLPDTPFTLVVCAGSLEYINDLAAFFRAFAECAPDRQMIFTYLLNPAKLTRQTMKVHNQFTDIDELLAHVGFAFSDIEVFAYRRRTVYFRGTLSTAREANWINRMSLNELLAEEEKSRPVRFLARAERSIRKRLRWFAR